MAKVEFKNFEIKYWGQDREILKNINFSFDTDERILLLSPSGMGKSTLLMSLLGIVQRNNLGDCSGSITIDGKNIESITSLEIACNFGVVFQEPESQFCLLYPDEEVAFTLENMSVHQRDMESTVTSALKKVGMLEKREQPLGNMSGGEQQRIAVASSIASGSKMLLLDEPTANLDVEGRRSIKDQVASLDKGFLLVEHNIDEWIDVVDRVIVLGRDGCIAWDTSIKKFLSDGSTLLETLGIWLPSKKWTEDKNIDHPVGKKLLTASNLNYKVKNKKIIDNFSMDINEGEVVALLGRNGSGKSTLSKILGRVIEPSKGSITYDGRNIKNITSKEYYSKIAYVFQNPEHQFIRDSVAAEIELSLSNFDSKKSIEDTLKKYNLYKVRNENPFTLSGGEKRRLSVAVMLSEDHKVLILDEPTFGLDYINAKKLMDNIISLAKKGMGVIIITHDMELVHRYASKAVIINDGSKVYEGHPSKLWEEKKLLLKNGLNIPTNKDILIKSVKRRIVV